MSSWRCFAPGPIAAGGDAGSGAAAAGPHQLVPPVGALPHPVTQLVLRRLEGGAHLNYPETKAAWAENPRLVEGMEAVNLQRGSMKQLTTHLITSIQAVDKPVTPTLIWDAVSAILGNS